ncbi:flagellar motor switch protein FliN [bacterium]|nr:flagellar motor switch protein FliN [bacterium]MBU1072830.1 flagellar motor switch protein FliN [bacterium]MBU1674550.1 flagellar motor switch protein FliN [bacterium]
MSPELNTNVNEATAQDSAVAVEMPPKTETPPAGTAAHQVESNSLEDDLAAAAPDVQNIGVLLDIDMKVTVELGRAKLKIRDIMNLSPGSVVELGKSPAEPVDILVNGVLLARGEVVVVDEHFAVRINKLLSRGERIRKLI